MWKDTILMPLFEFEKRLQSMSVCHSNRHHQHPVGPWPCRLCPAPWGTAAEERGGVVSGGEWREPGPPSSGPEAGCRPVIRGLIKQQTESRALGWNVMNNAHGWQASRDRGDTATSHRGEGGGWILLPAPQGTTPSTGQGQWRERERERELML